MNNAGEYLQTTETLYAIAAVTLAITSKQNDEKGYSCVRPAVVDLIAGFKEWFGGPFMRPLRPLLVPLTTKKHIVLGMIQLNEAGRPCIWILDSAPWYLGDEGE